MSTLVMPPRTRTSDGALRRVGIELEMNGIDIDSLSRLVAGDGHYQIEKPGRYERRLTGDDAGDWVVELDSSLVKRLGRKPRPEDPRSAELMSSAEDALIWVAEALVPAELVSPPLPLNRLDEVNALIARLREAGAKGTGDRLTNAFGMQFNPEIPDDRADTITAYLKAFLCLYDWLAERTEVNLARRITTYVDPFPAAYVKRVTTPEYWPDQARLIDDYLEHNPTRNRALDMLPLFRHLDEQRVLARAPDPLIKARPTFHYRLPDCRIDEPGWDMTPAWNDWLQIERLACDRERLQRCCEAYQQWLHQGLGRLLESWPRQVERDWLSRDAQ